MAMIVPCPPQPVAERHQDCWCEELVDVEKLHEVWMLFWRAANLTPKSPEICKQLRVERSTRRADALPLAEVLFFQ